MKGLVGDDAGEDSHDLSCSGDVGGEASPPSPIIIIDAIVGAEQDDDGKMVSLLRDRNSRTLTQSLA